MIDLKTSQMGEWALICAYFLKKPMPVLGTRFQQWIVNRLCTFQFTTNKGTIR